MSKLKPLKRLREIKVKSLRQLFSTPRRWSKGHFFSDDRMSCCLLGGVNLVYKNIKDNDCIRKKLEKAILEYTRNRPTGRITSHVPTFNDDVSTTFEDIKQVVKLAGV